MLATYGSGIIQAGSLSYTGWLALYTNRFTASFQQAIPIAIGIAASFGTKMPPEWYELFAESEELVERLQNQAELLRMEREAMQRASMGH